MQLLGSTPGLCGSMAAPAKWCGNSSETRKHSSLQMAAHSDDTPKSPTWCAMKLARGLKIVRSSPRSRINLSWFASIESRSSSSEILSSDARGRAEGSFKAATWRFRQSSSALGAVV